MAKRNAVAFKRIFAGLLIAISPITLPSSTVAQDEPEAPIEAAPDAATSDMVFLSGDELVVAQETTDDLFAAGNAVTISGAAADHLFIAGGDLTISSAQVSDIVAAGGEILLEAASVSDDVVIAGGEIVAKKDFEIGGTAVIMGGSVRFEAPVGQDLRIGANEIYVNSVVPGTARLTGDAIELGPNARIGGDLLYRGSSLTVDPAAVIEGGRTEVSPSEDYTVEDLGKGIGGFFLSFSLSVIVSYFVIVALLVMVVPKVMQATSDMLSGKPLQALGIGVLFAAVVPVLGLLLFSTGVGIPLAIFLFVMSLALTPIAVAVTAHFIGMFVRTLMTKKEGPAESTAARFLWPLSGVVILFALAMVPIAGLLVVLLAMLFGLGAFGRQVMSLLTGSPAPSAPTQAIA